MGRGRGRKNMLSSIFPHPLPTHFFQVNMLANSNMAANLRSRALEKTPALQARDKTVRQMEVLPFIRWRHQSLTKPGEISGFF